MKISNSTLHKFLLLFLVLSNSLILSSKAQANENEAACNDPEYFMQIRCRDLQELEERNQWNRQMGILNAQEREQQQKMLIVAGVIIGLVTIGAGTLLFKLINRKKGKSNEA